MFIVVVDGNVTVSDRPKLDRSRKVTLLGRLPSLRVNRP